MAARGRSGTAPCGGDGARAAQRLGGRH
jgi:hypothetical protein